MFPGRIAPSSVVGIGIRAIAGRLAPRGLGERHLWARRILADHDAFKHEATALQSGLTGQLRLGVIPEASTTAALLIDPFCAAHPLARVSLETSLRSAQVVKLLRRFELDAGIIYLEGQGTDGLSVTPLYQERQVLLASPDLLASPSEPISWPEVELPLCLLNSGMRGRQALDEALAARGLAVTPQLETDSVAALYAQVGTGRWAGIVPYPWTRTIQPPAGTRVLSLCDPEVRSRIAVVTMDTEPGSVLVRALVETARLLRLDELFIQDPFDLPL